MLSPAGDPAVQRSDGARAADWLLMELEDHNCWTIAEAAGHCGPHRLQHLLSRAVWDDRQRLDTASVWAVKHLDDGDAVLIVDATAGAWHRMRTGSGTKGTRHYDWAMLEVASDDTPDGHNDGHSVLLVRRHRFTGQLSFYRCWTPAPVPLSRLIAIASAKWRIEEYHQLPRAACPRRARAARYRGRRDNRRSARESISDVPAAE